MKPKISVLMPVYNSEKYVDEAIKSILDQTFGDFELVIINDGSTDLTAEIVRGFNDRRIKFIDNKINKGLISVLNQGLELVEGEYVARMDADDISMPTRFEEQVDFFSKNPDVSILGTWLERFEGAHGIINPPSNIGLWELYEYNPILHPSVMWRRADLEKHNLRYDPDYVAAEDYELWVRASRYLKIANIPKVLGRYRSHGESASVRMMALQNRNASRIRQTLLDAITPNPVLQKKLRRMRGGRRRFWLGIPLLKIKNDSVYLFDVIPLLSARRNRWRLFGFLSLFKKIYER
jgi:glycosyltransferase involved in cell wall biosynthesis